MQGFETEREEYEIIVLYRQTNEWNDDAYAFAPNSIIVKILSKIAHEEGRCVIIVTHDPTVSQTADVVLHMQDGELSLY